MAAAADRAIGVLLYLCSCCVRERGCVVKRFLFLALVFLCSGCGLRVAVGPAGVSVELGQPGAVVVPAVVGVSVPAAGAVVVPAPVDVSR
jgi:hypothetical protein